MVFHSRIDRAGAVELFRQDKAGKLVRQRDAPQTDACLRCAFHTVVQPVGGADDKGHIPCTAHGTVGDHSSQILTRYLFALHTECDKIRALAHRCKDGLALLLQSLGNLLIAGIFMPPIFFKYCLPFSQVCLPIAFQVGKR